MDRTYEHAIELIDSRRRLKRPNEGSVEGALKGAKPPPSGTLGLRGTPSIEGMSEWLQMLGHPPQSIDSLNIIHVAGTKGKGSTCSFAESILRAHGHRTGFPAKIGLYTSPHLIHSEERIRLNGLPLPRDTLAKYFFEVYDHLPQLHHPYDPAKDTVERGPRYLQLWALLAFHVFIREGVDAAVIETHSGGEYDATNVIGRPIVAAITTLGMDHIDMLGPTIDNIAWHKAGIFKKDSVKLSTEQDAGPAAVLEKRAKTLGGEVMFVGVDDARLPKEVAQLKPSVQRKNACLALAAADAFVARTSPEQVLTAEDVQIGIEQWSWPGRFQVIVRGVKTWYLDAAHNDMSVKLAAEWFAEMITSRGGKAANRDSERIARVLIFSHINELRDAAGVLSSLAEALRARDAGVEHVIFTTYDEGNASVPSHLEPEDSDTLIGTWKNLLPDTQVWKGPTISGALARAEKLGDEAGGALQTLITGSQHLVGPALQMLQRQRQA